MPTLTDRVSPRESIGRQPAKLPALLAKPDQCGSDLDGADEKASMYKRLLSAQGSADLRRVAVVVADGRVILSGQVSSFYQKQLAQETLRPYLIGTQIDNRIDVKS